MLIIFFLLFHRNKDLVKSRDKNYPKKKPFFRSREIVKKNCGRPQIGDSVESPEVTGYCFVTVPKIFLKIPRDLPFCSALMPNGNFIAKIKHEQSITKMQY